MHTGVHAHRRSCFAVALADGFHPWELPGCVGRSFISEAALDLGPALEVSGWQVPFMAQQLPAGSRAGLAFM